MATCGQGYRFTDGSEQLYYSCQSGPNATPWSPSRVVPDCVTVDTRESTYDVVATMTYKAQSAEIPSSCIDSYKETVANSFPDLSEVLTGRCSAGGVSIDVNFKPTMVGEVKGNTIQLCRVIQGNRRQQLPRPEPSSDRPLFCRRCQH